jgi:AraC-like DNA-binding protein
MSDEIDSISDAKHRPRLSDKQRGLILFHLREGVKSTEDIAKEAGCSARHVRRLALKEGVKPPNRVEQLAREALDRNEVVAKRAYDTLRRMPDSEWDKLNPNTLSQIIERHSSLLFRQIEAERIRNAPPPVYQPMPILMLMDGVLFGQRP